jgi:hypothetical protein
MTDMYTVARSTTINAPAETIYEQIVDFHNWQAWSPWDHLDPDMQRTYSGPASGVGASYAWTGNRKVGEGRMKITEAAEQASVQIALDFLKPFKSSSTTTFNLQPKGESTEVTWTMTGPKTLMTRIMGIYKSMDKMIGPDLEKGLTQLKGATEQPAS